MENLEEKNKGYIITSIDEYFEILDRESQKRSKIVAKSLTKYLKRVHSENSNPEKITAIN